MKDKQMLKHIIVFFLLLLGVKVPALAQVSLVKDIYKGNGDSRIGHFTKFSKKIAFVANGSLFVSDGKGENIQKLGIADHNAFSEDFPLIQVGDKIFFNVHRSELWISDGTQAGTKMVKKFTSEAMLGRNHAVVGNKLFFTSTDNTHGNELWVSDGTEAGTKMVKDIKPGKDHSNIFRLQALGDKVCFLAEDGIHGREPWISDGTEAGTKIIKDIEPGTNMLIANFIVVGNKFFFQANDGVNGTELWVSDGTEAGTKMAKDINPGNAGSSPMSGFIAILNDKIYFTAFKNLHGRELWVSDGTEAGTKMIKDINPGFEDGFIVSLTAVNNQLFFQANNGIHGRELWVSDGTEAGTKMIKDINPGKESSLPSNFVELNSRVYFIADDGTHGRELWETNGTALGTHLVKDILPGKEGGFLPARNAIILSGNSSLQSNGSELFFGASDGTHGRELWVSDGTEAGTKLVKDINPGTNQGWQENFFSFGDKFYFAGRNDTNGIEVWVSDGTQVGTQMLADLNMQVGQGAPGQFISLGDQLFFAATDQYSGRELWVSDGTEKGTRLFKDILPGKGFHGPHNGLGIPRNPKRLGDKLYFIANGSVHGFEVWVTDGTQAGTKMLKDINPTSSSVPSELTVVQNQLFFTANDGTHGRELWVTDGTEAGTKMVKDIITGTNSGFTGSFAGFISIGDKLFFRYNDGIHGEELWVTDGTEAGTKMVKDINPGTANSIGSITGFNWKIFDGKLHFVADDGTHGLELWVTDGTEVGTKLIKDIRPGKIGMSASGNISLTKYKDKLYFRANDGVGGLRLWVTDGTQAGTQQLDNRTSGISATARNLKVFKDQLFFVTNEGLWRTDGTLEKTFIVKHGFTSTLDYAMVTKDRVLFTISTQETGRELWETDGTEAGTRLVEDLNPGYEGSFPHNFYEHKGKVYFTANPPETGRELFVYNPQPFPALIGPTINNFSPKTGFTGTRVRISGANFSKAIFGNQVLFNGTKAKVLSASTTELLVEVSTGTSTGKITIKVDSLQTISEENFVISQVTGLASKLSSGGIKIYPNPVSNILNFNFDQLPLGKVQLKIYDTQGRIISESNLPLSTKKAQLSLSSLKRGLYIIQVFTDSKIFSGSFIKR